MYGGRIQDSGYLWGKEQWLGEGRRDSQVKRWVSVSGGYTDVFISWRFKMYNFDQDTVMYIYYTSIFHKNTYKSAFFFKVQGIDKEDVAHL